MISFMKYQFQFKKRIRLKDFSYKGCHRYFITICTSNRRVVFTDKIIVDRMISDLKYLSDNYGFIVWAYCFMPDHVHFLIEGRRDDSDMRRFISMYKQKTGYWYKQQYQMSLWQINYYEHVLRNHEDMKAIVNYIFGNPVRDGIVEDCADYPFQGSFMFTIKQP